MSQSFAVTETERRFEILLDEFRKEAETAAQLLYTYLTIHEMARQDDVLRALNRRAAFWLTASHALLVSCFIALHRLFDTDSEANADSLLKFVEAHGATIFSRNALAARMTKRDAIEPPGWVLGAHEGTLEQFQRFRGSARQRRNLYKEKYLPIRNKVLAHKIASDAVANQWFQNTNEAELREIVAFLVEVYESLWSLYYNGESLTLDRPAPSVEDVRQRTAGRPGYSQGVHDTERVLRDLVALYEGQADGANRVRQ